MLIKKRDNAGFAGHTMKLGTKFGKATQPFQPAATHRSESQGSAGYF
jgi:hypothetical protein